MSKLDVFMQIIGFFIQVAPFALLLLVPYQQEDFCQSKHKIGCKLISMILLLSFIFPIYLAFVLQISLSNRVTRQYADLYFLAAILGVGSWSLHLNQSSLIKKLLILVIVIHYGAFVFTISAAFYHVITVLPGSDIVIYCVRNNVINVILLCTSYPLTYLFMKRTVRHALPAMGQKAMRRGCCYMILALLLYCIAIYALTYPTNGSIVHSRQLLFITAIVITDSIVYFMFFSEANVAMENYYLQQLIQFNHTYYYKLMNDIEEAKQTRHDVHHHLNMIAALHSQGKTQELTSYLKRYADVLHERDELVITGHAVIDSILNYYKARAKSLGINIGFHADNLAKQDFNEITDITVLCSTALDRAIDACRASSISKMDVSMYRHHQTLLLLITYKVGQAETKLTNTLQQDTYRLQHLCEQSGGAATFYQKEQLQIDRYVFNLKPLET